MQLVPHSLPYKKELDGIRGIAIILVVFFHIWPEYFSFGFVGVDIFFVLSGYLITKIIISKSDKNDFSLYEFYRNRIRRIFPALIIVLSATAIVGYLFLFPEELKVLGKHIKSSALFYQNFRLIDEAGYWDESGQLKPLLHFWSLSIEEQFYIIWPLLIILFIRFRLLVVLPLIGVLLIYVSYKFNNESNTFFHSLTRFWELAIGAMAVWLERFHHTRRLTGKAHYFIWTGLVIAIALFYQENTYDLVKTFFLVTVVALLIISLKDRNDFLLGWSVLVFVGIISYPLYLWHYPIISFAHIFGISVVKNGIWIFLISLMLSYFTYRYVEVYARKQTDIKVIASLFFLVIFIAGIGQYIKEQDGLPDRPHLTNIKKTQVQFIRESAKNNNCIQISTDILRESPKFDYCKSTVQSKAEQYVAIIGDSHAHVLYPGFREQLAENGFETILLSNSGCPSFISGARGKTVSKVKQCQIKIEQIYKVLENMQNLNKVIIAARGPTYTTETGFGVIEKRWTENPSKYGSYFNDDDNNNNYNPKKIYFTALQKTIRYLVENEKSVYVFLENPELGFSPKSCIDRPFGITSHACTVSFNEYNQRMQTYRNAVIEIVDKYQNVFVLDPETYLCDDKNCYARIDGNMLYADGDHFSVLGSQYIAKKMIDQIVNQNE